MAFPINALTTLGVVKSELGIAASDTTEDSFLRRQIVAASDATESYLDRKIFYEAGIVEKVAGFGSFHLKVSRTPLLVITSITDDGETVDLTNVEIDNAGAGLIRRPEGWRWTRGVKAGITNQPYPGSEEKLFTVTYTGGWVTPHQETEVTPADLERTLPHDIEDAVIELITLRRSRRGRDPTIKAEKLLSWSATYDISLNQHGIPPAVAFKLDRYRTLSQA